LIDLTDEMKTALDSALADKVPCILATASADGLPGIGYRGSVMAFDGQSLAYWERAKRDRDVPKPGDRTGVEVLW